ncbi:RNA polymerase sigma factor SigJ [Luteimonas sp. TWI662]|uniref:RNA polymerase sigma factor SigJ n=1 Tax=Luteimonas sp. TWI662 TaxID=3136789 RepID=UPI00320899C8
MTDRPDDGIAAFDHARPGLLGLAYRLLGSRADAEDAVQDTYLKWQRADRATIVSAGAWLTTACTRHCLDLLRNAHRNRVDYVGTWLPEPLRIADDIEPQAAAELASTLTSAFLLLLERLTPKERAAYLLHEIFEMDYTDIAKALDMQEPACRKLVSRAHAHVGHPRVRHITPPARQTELLTAFERAIRSGQTEQLALLLSRDVRLAADGGGKVSAARRIMVGEGEVLRFIAAGLHIWWADYAFERVIFNGHLGLILRDATGTVTAAASFSYDETGRLSDIFIMRNPDKLVWVEQAAIEVL